MHSSPIIKTWVAGPITNPHTHAYTQISYASTLAALSDRSRFPNYFRNDLPVAAPALHATLDHFKWKRIALLTQDESLFTVVN